MKKLALFVLFCTIAFFACKKNDYKQPTTPTTPVADSNAMKFTITGFMAQTMEWKDTVAMPVAAAYLGGNQEMLTMSVTGLPENVTAVFSTVSAKPPFSTVLTLTSNAAKKGDYVIKIKGTTSRDSVQTFDMPLTINAENCATARAGVYTNEQTYTSGAAGQTGQTTVETTTTPNEILFKDLLLGGNPFQIKGKLDCGNRTLTIETQQFTQGSTSYSISGSGTFSDNGIKLSFFLDQIGSTAYDMTVNSTLVRK